MLTEQKVWKIYRPLNTKSKGSAYHQKIIDECEGKRESVLEYIRVNCGSTIKEIMKGTGHCYQFVRAATEKFYGDDKITRKRIGRHTEKTSLFEFSVSA